MKDKNFLKIIILITIIIVLCIFFYQKYKINYSPDTKIQDISFAENKDLNINSGTLLGVGEKTTTDVNTKNTESDTINKIIKGNGKVFYGYSAEPDGTLVKFSNLTPVSSVFGTSRTSIGTQSFNAKSSEYIYFAWLKSFEPEQGCSHDASTYTTCFMTPIGAYPVMVRSVQSYDSQEYYVYRSRDTGVSSVFTIK
ncbi:MAG: hypothetical protein NTU81_01490 [Candidatus Nomurabacteria bacterium]|nr:hypothetical protein [Candidatus Nomurabacteria bacterium]